MISLRTYESQDAKRICELANNRKVSKYLTYTFPYPYTKTDAEWWINIGSSENGATTRAIEYNQELVGSIGVTPQIGWRAHIAEIGYWVGEAYWGRGIATAALMEMTDYAFSTLGYKKLIAPVLAENPASMAVLRKCAYQLEAILENEVFKNDRFYDIHLYKKLAD